MAHVLLGQADFEKALQCRSGPFDFPNSVTLSVAEGSEMLRQAQHDVAGTQTGSAGVSPAGSGLLSALTRGFDTA